MESRGDILEGGSPIIDTLQRQQIQTETMPMQTDNYEYLMQSTVVNEPVPPEIQLSLWSLGTKASQLTNLTEKQIALNAMRFETAILEIELLVPEWEETPELEANFTQARIHNDHCSNRAKKGFERNMQTTRTNVGSYEYRQRDDVPSGGITGGVKRLFGRR